jgi:flagellar biosynthesis protein FlhB
MAEDKPFAPSESRLRKARQDGDRPQIAEVVAISAFAAGWWALEQVIPHCFESVAEMLRRTPTTISGAMYYDYRGTMAMPVLWNADINAIAGSVATVLGAASSAAILIAVLFRNLGWKMPSFQLSRLAPAQNLKKVFSLDTLTAAGRSLCMTLVVLTVILAGLWSTMQSMLGSIVLGRTISLALDCVHHNVAVLIIFGGVFSLLEARSTLTQWYRKLRMDYAELQREYREQTGDPHQRSQRKRRHRKLLRNRNQAVRQATVIVTNPTHIAIALLYDPPSIAVPVIVARAADKAAADVRKIAEQSGVPLVEAVAVARYLYARAAEGDAIPLDAYAMVAPIIAAALAQRM